MTRLLLVTQYSDERDIYGDALRAEGFDVKIASSPEDAYAEAVREKPDVVVTRVPQPGDPGPDSELLRQLKQDTQTQSVPVVVITSMMRTEERTKPAPAESDGYVLIPALPDALVREIRRVLSRHPARARSGR